MRIKLATKFLVLVLAVLALGVLNSAVALYSSRKLESLLRTTVEANVASVRAAEKLEIALLEQRGLVSAYILDDLDPVWLGKLREVEPEFHRWLSAARQTASSPDELEILDRVEVVYRQYDAKRRDVIRLCQEGDVAEATGMLLVEVQKLHQDAFDLCELFLKANELSVRDAVEKATWRVERLTVIVGALVLTTIVCGGSLLWLFYGSVLLPLRRIAGQMKTLSDGVEPDHSWPGDGRDELAAIREYLSALMSDVAGVRFTLRRNQAQLQQAQKLASVGRLAANVAHEIRSPLTAMKMWLFSLHKSVGPDPDTDRKFDLIADELARLESVVENFLDFSKPTDTRPQPHQVAVLVEKTLELLNPRLAEKGVRVAREGLDGLPPVAVDAEQIKQVLINLLTNAAEAMPDGGEVAVSAQCRPERSGKPMVVLRIQDCGQGMSKSTQELIFQPFFTTKRHGTGLGLCIAAQIMASHGGRLMLESTSDRGSCFAMWIPTA